MFCAKLSKNALTGVDICGPPFAYTQDLLQKYHQNTVLVDQLIATKTAAGAFKDHPEFPGVAEPSLHTTAYGRAMIYIYIYIHAGLSNRDAVAIRK